MRITPQVVGLTWDYLAAVLPLVVPPSKDVKIILCKKHPVNMAEWRVTDNKYALMINMEETEALAELTRLITHEMIHAHQTLAGTETTATHNADFRRLWRKIAQMCGWDRKRIT